MRKKYKEPIYIRDPDKAFVIQAAVSVTALIVSAIALIVKMLHR